MKNISYEEQLRHLSSQEFNQLTSRASHKQSPHPEAQKNAEVLNEPASGKIRMMSSTGLSFGLNDAEESSRFKPRQTSMKASPSIRTNKMGSP